VRIISFNTKITVLVNGFTLKITVLTDSGSDKNILPLHLLPTSLHKFIKPADMEFTGCGKIKAIGKIYTIVKAHKSNYKFRDVCFYSHIPNLGRPNLGRFWEKMQKSVIQKFSKFRPVFR
jgi:hypothetical protein